MTPASDFYGRLALAPSPFPPPQHSAPPPHHLPFPFLPPIPPGTDPTLAEHLLKLASLQQRAAGILPPELPKPPTSSPYTVLSAMLGHRPTPHHYPNVFPGMPSVFPPAAALAAAAAASSAPSPFVKSSIKEEPFNASSSSIAAAPGSEKKPFVCNFCMKEFGHLSSLESHMDHMHSGDAKHSCDVCGKSFSSKSNLTWIICTQGMLSILVTFVANPFPPSQISQPTGRSIQGNVHLCARCAIRGSGKKPTCKSMKQRIVRPRPISATSVTRPLAISRISTLTWPLIATSGPISVPIVVR